MCYASHGGFFSPLNMSGSHRVKQISALSRKQTRNRKGSNLMKLWDFICRFLFMSGELLRVLEQHGVQCAIMTINAAYSAKRKVCYNPKFSWNFEMRLDEADAAWVSYVPQCHYKLSLSSLLIVSYHSLRVCFNSFGNPIEPVTFGGWKIFLYEEKSQLLCYYFIPVKLFFSSNKKNKQYAMQYISINTVPKTNSYL